MGAFLKLEQTTTRIALVLGVSFLIIATILALYQVTTRFVFGHPSIWSETFTRGAMIWSVFFGAAVGYQRGGHRLGLCRAASRHDLHDHCSCCLHRQSRSIGRHAPQ